MPEFYENAIAASIILVLSWCGLALYLCVTWVIVTRRAQFKHSYFTLILCLSVADCLALLCFATYFPAAVLLQAYPLGETFDWLFGVFQSIAWFLSLGFVVSISFNRYIAICHFASYKQWYTQRRIYANIAAVVVVAFLLASPELFPCCRVRFFPAKYTFGFDYSLPGAVPLTRISICINACTILSMFFCFTRIFVDHRRSKNAVVNNTTHNQQQEQPAANQQQLQPPTTAATALSKQQEKLRREQYAAEIKLAAQFVGVAVFLVIYNGVFTLLFNISTYHWHLYLVGVFGVFNHSINPILYVCMSKTIREALVETFRGLCGQQSEVQHFLAPN